MANQPARGAQADEGRLCFNWNSRPISGTGAVTARAWLHRSPPFDGDGLGSEKEADGHV